LTPDCCQERAFVTTNKNTWPLMVGALGVVYGDIGTSPLYALREALHAAGGSDTATVFGLLSLLFWALTAIVTIKYVGVMLRADNAGEGGILSLVALAQQRLHGAGPWLQRIVALGVLGTALFYCDALITPAVSVLSAVEGLQDLDPDFQQAVIPLTLGILIALFAIQRHGTARVASWFGPVMLLWFAVLGVTGAIQIARHPEVLRAVNPQFAAQLLNTHPATALVILGAVFLAVTGAEALYADMGHFGRGPVQYVWFGLVWPALLLNYFGQGALVLGTGAAIANPFFAMTPTEALPALVLLATAATIIASQATISGAYSVTRQAVQLDLLPRVKVVQTSAREHGQIYVPAANLLLLVAAVGFVLAFRSSSALTSAYGASVIGTMFITSMLGAVVARMVWNWPVLRVALVFGSFALVELAFVVGNATKIPSGGWVPLTLALLLYGLFLTWRDGRQRLRRELAARAVPIARLGQLLEGVARVPGTAAFLVSDASYVPTALLRNLEHNHVCHEQIVIMQMEIVRQPRVDPLARTSVRQYAPGIYILRARFGFVETPDASEALRMAARTGLNLHVADTSFFVGWHLVRELRRSGWGSLRRRLFATLQSRSTQAADYFQMPRSRVIVLATEVELR
jgi:KUP system potassium uptake protein